MADDPKRNPIILEVRSNADPQQRNEGEYGPLSLDLFGRLRLIQSAIEGGIVPADALAAVESMPVGAFLLAFNGATWDQVRAALPADAAAAIEGLVTTAQLQAFNGATWDQVRAALPADAAAAIEGLVTTAQLQAFNGATWDQVRAALPADAAAAIEGLVTTAQLMGFNGATWDRLACNTLGGYNALGLTGTPVVNALIGVSSGSNHVPLSGKGLGTDPIIGGTGMIGMSIPVHKSKTGIYVRQRCLDTFNSVKFTAAGSSLLWTPAAGASFRLMRFQVDVTGGVTAAAAADLDIVFYDGAIAMPIGQSVYIPAVVSGNSWSSGWVGLDNGILSAAADNVLNVNLSFALTAGVVRVTVAGTEE